MLIIFLGLWVAAVISLHRYFPSKVKAFLNILCSVATWIGASFLLGLAQLFIRSLFFLSPKTRLRLIGPAGMQQPPQLLILFPISNRLLA